ncbi:family 20 glycosylhydrolase [Levilactobacillus yiduensis]|uniref:family 20 glycosylhydrolase n=1 Tax=Levilactobacillus yiduensis TaxID=2953880 RepID=UPI000EF2D5A6|nr:family 20 glycosylhydrolase [Levilactobacillus yiduensis]AYM02104.1 N-acetyl-beta-hexosaminidase [Levilactobacillus brevis]
MHRRLRFGLLTLLALLSILLFCGQPTQAQAAANPSAFANRQGLLIDLGRHPLSEKGLQQVIQAAADQKFHYVVLHLSDNEHLSFQSKYLKNKATKTVLSPAALKRLVSFAKTRDVQLVPALDVPAHTGALLRQLKKSHPKIYRHVKLDSQSLDYTNQATVTLVKKLYQELDTSFKKQPQRALLLGADEVPGTDNDYKQLTTFINQLNQFQNKRGYTTIVWNDSLLKGQLSKLNRNIVVNYWSQSGNRATTKALSDRRANRVSVSDLLKAKRTIVNANSYATYYQLQFIGNAANDQYFTSYLRDSYRPYFFNEISATGQNQDRTYEPKVTTTGTLVSLWGHDAQGVKTSAIVDFIHKLDVPK